jgi:hypothetical protein
VELHVARGVRLPPARLRELAEWCGRHFTREYDTHGDDDA